MTRKDYVLIAEVFRNAKQYQDRYISELTGDDRELTEEIETIIRDAREQLAADLASKLNADNPAFDRQRFLTACGIAGAI